MKEAIEGYLESRPHLKPSSLKSERLHLLFFQRFLSTELSVFELREVQREHLAAYYKLLLERSDNGKNLRLLSEYLGSLRRFFRWAQNRGYLLVAWELPRPKFSPKMPRVPTRKEVLRLLGVPEEDTALGRRDRFALELLYGLGLRLEECVRLDLTNLDLTELTVAVHGKGDRRRRLPLSPRLAVLAHRYLEKTRPEFAPPAAVQALFLSLHTGTRLCKAAMYLRIKLYAWQANLKIRPHQLRHACATHMLEAGAGVAQVQALLGHAQVSTTQRYARVSLQELKREFRRCHPRARHPDKEPSDAPSDERAPTEPAPGGLL